MADEPENTHAHRGKSHREPKGRPAGMLFLVHCKNLPVPGPAPAVDGTAGGPYNERKNRSGAVPKDESAAAPAKKRGAYTL